MTGFFTNTHEAYADVPAVGEAVATTFKTDLTFEGQVKSVSFSTMSTFEHCPYSVYLSKVHNGGIPPLGSEAMNRGTEIHEMLEQYVLGEIENVNWLKPKSKDYHAQLINTFRDGYAQGIVIPELQIAVRKDMSECEWVAPDVWLRGAIDVCVFNDKPNKATHCTIYDYKTGSDYSAAKHRTQLQLYDMLMFILYPNLQTISSAAIYLDYRKDPFFNEYSRSDLDLYWPPMKQRLMNVTDATTFIPIPNKYNCKWCQHKQPQEKLEQTEAACAFAAV